MKGDIMLKNQQEITAAVAKVTEGRLAIWNARLELAVSTGDAKKVDAILSRLPGEAAGGGCGCGCGCGGGSEAFAAVTS
jgi:hypothetical protein